MESKHKQLVEELELLGYYNTLSLESVPLVEKLVGDLTITTKSLEKYMKISKKAIEENNNLQFGAKPLREQNDRLVKEYEHLNKVFEKYKEESLRKEKVLTNKIDELKSSNADAIVENEKLKRRLANSDRISTAKSPKNSLNKNKKSELSSTQMNKGRKKNDQEVISQCSSKCTQMALAKEVQKLKEQNLKLMTSNETLQQQLLACENEMKKVGTDSTSAPNVVLSPCKKENTEKCYCEEVVISKKIDVNTLCKINSCLKQQLKDAQEREREATKKCLSLVERNRLLETEMLDIDNLALAVETSCNNQVKITNDKMLRLQERMHAAINDTQKLYTENHKLNIEINELKTQLKTCIEEKQDLVNDKKLLNEKINNFTKIEEALNTEIDRLTLAVKKQELENLDLKTKIKKSDKSETTVKQKSKNTKSVTGQSTTCTCCEEVQKFLLNEIENIRQEKQYYMEEYQKMCKNINNNCNQAENLIKEIADKTKRLAILERENQCLSEEKSKLMLRLETEKKEDPTKCDKDNCKRLLRDIDIMSKDLKQLEKERDNLEEKLQCLKCLHKTEKDRLNKEIEELRNRNYTLDDENRKNSLDSAKKSEYECLCRDLQEKLKNSEYELQNERKQVQMLKNLCQENERTLKDTQSRLISVEADLAKSSSQCMQQTSARDEEQKRIELLRKDCDLLVRQLAELEKEKDELLAMVDSKTEKICDLERQIRSKDMVIQCLEKTRDELKEQLRNVSSNAGSKEYLLKSTQSELTSLKEEFNQLKRLYDHCMDENRRLQNDLAASACDCNNSRRELDNCKRQVEDLKTQLKHYIAEVKRTEDLISLKEVERNNILDQFRSLSEEANMLENNNHTLENEASHTRVQLSVALDHAADLERRVESQEKMIESYEQQISELTTQLASFEIDTNQIKHQLERAENEIEMLKEKNAKLEQMNKEIRQKSYRDNLEDQGNLLKEIEKEKNRSDSLKEMWTKAKQEAADMNYMNKNLQAEIDKLKDEVQDLKERFGATTTDERTRDYLSQNRELRREFSSYRSRDSSGSHQFTSL